ncbi:MAG: hypothetical protein JWQ66_3030 [Mucilaginibacter sp.]|nr:hypothetical protein [Mucilaginibacter sp.]
MKKILIILFLITASYGLKAQQLTLKPVDPLLFKSLPNASNNFKLSDSTLFKDFSKLSKIEQLADMPGSDINDKNAEVFYSRMPVAKLYSDDRMPVARIDNIDRMPVKKIIIVDPLVKLKQPAP